MPADDSPVEARSFVVRFFVIADGRAVARVTDARSTRQWLIAEPEALRALERALTQQPQPDKERQ
jgi:hypothetical protein